MAGLSISRAWDESKARIAADGRLIMIVALALVALPAVVAGLIDPPTAQSAASFPNSLVTLLTALIAIIGQLAIIRLTLGTSVSVGEAIAHGARRMPIYFVSGLIIIAIFILALLPIVAIGVAMGVPLESETAAASSPVMLVLLLLYFLFVLFVAVRLMLSSPVASEEPLGPIAILRRSWELSRGHWWRLFGFIALFLLGAAIVITAVNWALSAIAVLLLGPVEPMSGSALLVALAGGLLNAAMTALLAVMLARIYVQLAGEEVETVSVPSSGT